MQAIPSEIPLSCTASRTSSVMSRTASPPAVRSWVSRWKTFTAPILRVPALYVTQEPSIPRHAAVGGRLSSVIRGRSARRGSADRDRPGYPLGSVTVDWAVHLVFPACFEGESDGLVRAGCDVSALRLVSRASTGLAVVAAAARSAAVAAAGSKQQRQREKSEQAAHGGEYEGRALFGFPCTVSPHGPVAQLVRAADS